MSLRRKLTIGLSFLFLIIFALSIYSMFEIQRLSKDADRILRDNYESLAYCKILLVSLDDMKTAASSRLFLSPQNSSSAYYSHLLTSAKTLFETNLDAEQNNITEIHEKEYVQELTSDYGVFTNLCLQIGKSGGTPALYFNDLIPAYSAARQTILDINDINMQAIERKSLSTRQNAGQMINSTAIIVAVCIILAFFYFWYFPFYVSNTLSHLSNKMKELLQKAGIKIDTQTSDEAFVLLQSIDLLETKFIKNKGKQGAKRKIANVQ
jgi:hypothetical protein